MHVLTFPEQQGVVPFLPHNIAQRWKFSPIPHAIPINPVLILSLKCISLNLALLYLYTYFIIHKV